MCHDTRDHWQIGGRPDHDDVLQAREVAHHLDDPVGEVPLHDHDAGARVLQLVAEVVALVGRVDRHADRPAHDRTPPGQQGLG